MPATAVAARARARALIVELVGPPGSGKSTIARLVQRADPGISIETFPYFRTPRHLPFFAWNTVRLAPELPGILMGAGAAHFPYRRDIALMIILTGWNEMLARRASHHDGVILLDEGPVCLMAKLRAFGATALQGTATSQWWHTIDERWRRAVDMFIVLDAPIPALLRRVRTRGAQFEIRDKTDEEACGFLEHIRSAQERVVQDLNSGSGNMCAVHVSTVGRPAETVAEEIRTLIGRKPIPELITARAGMEI